MTPDDGARDLALWLRLERTPGVGRETARRLLGGFGLPADIFAASRAALLALVPERIAAALCGPPAADIAAQIDTTLEWAARPGNHVLTLAEAAYPASLLDIPDPPLLVYAKGRVELLARRSIAVVGSRNATSQGMINAERFAAALSEAGLTVVSGMALGIDTAAHTGGLRGSGSTIAVIGTGADIVYPARNRALAARIAEDGCIVSEYPLGMQAIAANFPRRNRIISGLSEGVLVIEAAAQSGSLITARMAGDQGREVFAIPGSIHSPLSKGCHLLIKQGAKLVECAQDILEELRWSAPRPDAAGAASGPPASAAALSPLAARALAQMGHDPVAPDALALRCETDIGGLHGALLALELDGLVEVLPGGMVRRIATS